MKDIFIEKQMDVLVDIGGLDWRMMDRWTMA